MVFLGGLLCLGIAAFSAWINSPDNTPIAFARIALAGGAILGAWFALWVLLGRAVRDLFATAPTAEETTAFIADKTPDALDALAKRFVARVDVVSFSVPWRIVRVCTSMPCWTRSFLVTKNSSSISMVRERGSIFVLRHKIIITLDYTFNVHSKLCHPTSLNMWWRRLPSGNSQDADQD